MQIKATIKYHLTSMCVAAVRKVDNTKYWRGYGIVEIFALLMGI